LKSCGRGGVSFAAKQQDKTEKQLCVSTSGEENKENKARFHQHERGRVMKFARKGALLNDEGGTTNVVPKLGRGGGSVGTEEGKEWGYLVPSKKNQEHETENGV